MNFRTRNVPLTLTRTGLARSVTLYAKFLFTFAGLSLFLGPMFAVFGALGAIVATVLTFVAYALALLPGTFSGTLEVTSDALSINGERSIPRGEIVSALVVPRDGNDTVEIELADGERLTAASTGSEARALVEALGTRRMRVPLARAAYRLIHVPLALVALVLAVGLGVLLTGAAGLGLEAGAWSVVAGAPGMAIAIYTLLQRLARPPFVVVGDDGVRIAGALGSRQIKHGEALSLGLFFLDHERVEAVKRLSEERAKASVDAAERLALFDRRGSTVEAWRARVVSAMDASSYREAPITVEDAALALRSPTASPEQRIGAALALRAAGEPAEKIRVAADAIVDEHVRVALGHVADDDELAVDRAIAEISR